MGEPVHGCDISSWQRILGCNWILASKLECRFAIVKLSQGFRVSRRGVKHVKRLLEANEQLRERGEPEIAVGGYHFARPLKRGLRVFDPEGQAEVFCNALQRSGWPYSCPSLVPSLDQEWISFGKTPEGKARGIRYRRQFHPSEVMEWSRRFCGSVADQLGVMVERIYTGKSFIRYRFARDAGLRFYDLWLASYVDVGPDRDHIPGRTEYPTPVVLAGRHSWRPSIWQWTGRGSVLWYREGKGKIDRNLIIGGEAAFQRLLIGGMG